MKCLNPHVLVRGENKYYFACRKCIACRINAREEWATRLVHEAQFSTSACFVTLTYRDDVLPFDPDTGEPCPSKRDCQLFLKRLRKDNPGSTIRYYLGSEKGPTTQRPHYHAIIYNLPLERCDWQYIEPIWSLGTVTVSEFTRERAEYVAKYYVERKDYEGSVPNFSLMSRRPGLGAAFVAYNRDYFKSGRKYVHRLGEKVPIPRYYKELAVPRSIRERNAQDYYELCRSGHSPYDGRSFEDLSEIERIMVRAYKTRHKKEI